MKRVHLLASAVNHEVVPVGVVGSAAEALVVMWW
jgi:hypothetical protein